MAENAQETLSLAIGNPSKGHSVRRAMDIALASIAFVALTPVMAFVVLLIWLESGAPFLFSQTRIGLRGREFCMYKFRKFRPSCSTNGSPLTLENDTRLTYIGKFLQTTKIDELPQLWNIIIGDMSIVGPRPETLHFRECYTNEFSKVLEYKPGIFGPSQVLFRHESSLFPHHIDPSDFYRNFIFPAKASIDLSYYSRRSISSDLGWIIRGVLAVFGYVPVSPQWASDVNGRKQNPLASKDENIG
jgi:lipopolysaccharide/colanic/teichoic acid biosynthesis glycosyltransferase